MTKVFISYNRDDGDAVDAVVRELAGHGYHNVFAYDLDGRGTRLGERWHPSLMAEARTCDVLVVLTGPASIRSQRCTEEITVALERSMPARPFELVVAGTAGNPLLADRQRLVLSDRSGRLDALVEALAEAGFEPSERAQPTESPYPGLRAFDAEDEQFFHGRDTLVTQIVDRLDGSTLTGGVVPILGPSGAGKSSLVRAGVMPCLRRGRDMAQGRALVNTWFVCDPFTPGESPLTGLGASLAQAAALVGSTSPLCNDPDGIAARLSADDVDAVLTNLLVGKRTGRVLLVLDQAEELLSRSDQTEVNRLIRALDTIIARRQAWLLYTLRSDFLTDLLHSGTAGGLVGESVLVPVLRDDELSAAIVTPARLVGWEYQPEVVAKMIVETRDSKALPLLAYALDRLFRRVQNEHRPGRTITLADYAAAGSVRDVLTAQADLAFTDAVARATEVLGATGGDGKTAQTRVLRLLRRFMSVQDGIAVRRPILVDNLDPVDRAILEPFIAKRIVAMTERNTAEVAHEALLTSWALLKDELDELREALQTRAEIERRALEWAQDVEQGRGGADALLSSSKLLAFLDIVRRGADLELEMGSPTQGWAGLRASVTALDLGESEIDYIGRSLQHALSSEITRVDRFVEPDPIWVSEELLGGQTELQRDLMSALCTAPDVGPLVELVHRTMAVNPVHLVVEAHEGGTWGAAWDPDGTQFATGGRDQAVRVWQLEDHGLRAALEMRHGIDAASRPVGAGWVRSVAWTSDGRHVLSVATDENLKIWDATHGSEVRNHLHPDRLWTVQTPAAGGLAVTAGADGEVRVYPVDRRSREPVVTVTIGHRVWAAALSPDGTSLAAACEDRHAYVVDLADPTTVRLRIPHPHKVRSIVWSPDGKLLATGCQDSVGRIFDACTGNVIHDLGGHTDQIRTVSFSPSGNRIATGSADLDVRVWDVATGRSVGVLSQHDQGVCALDWAPSGDRLLSAADDGTARIWKVGSDPEACLGFGRPVTAIAWHPDLCTLAVALADNPQTATSDVLLVVPGRDGHERAARHVLPVTSLAWTGDGDLITASVDQTAVLWRSGSPVVTYTGARDGVVAAFPLPGRDLLLGASRDRVIRLWTIDGPLRTDDEPEWHTSFLTDADCDATGRRFAAVGDDRQLSVHELDGDKPIRTDVGGRATAVAWNWVTDEIAVGRSDGTILIYDCTDGIQPHPGPRLQAHPAAITALAWSPDGDLLCVASEDKRASIWSTRSGAQRTVLVGHTAAVTGCSWVGQREVVTCGGDGYVRWWNVEDADLYPSAGLPGDHDVRSADYLRRVLDELGYRIGKQEQSTP
ncbi:hypothetical protein GCM10023200_19770 [Actinomycetospora chlora]|uniref:TIR domain-containing protein n=1 Tax=Actinomycetospora chlora TaxID=663608 RepID=A0ABP9ATW0_9PSEU